MAEVKLAGRYRLESEIARGGMARVYRAVDEVLNRTVAAKILHDRLAGNPQLLERFHFEALAAARLTHPNIVSVFDTGQYKDVPFIVMEFLPGGTLRELMASEGPLEHLQVAAVCSDVCLALAHAHELGVIHRDIKPANILFSEAGHTKVADFGIAKAAFGPDLTDTGALLGTVRYLSPELVQGEEPDSRSDIYSLGVVMYEALTGSPPFSGDNEIAEATARIGKLPKPPRDLRPGLPRRMEAVVMRALAPSPQDRYQSAHELRHDLDAMAGSERERAAVPDTPTVSLERQPAPPSFVKSEGRWLLPIVLILLVAAGLTYGAVRLGVIENPIDTLRGVAGPSQPVDITGVATYDPEGDGSENPNEAGNAIDGDPQTVWRTDTYRTKEFGRLKEGLGIYIDLGQARDVEVIEVTSVTGGWSGTVRSSDDPGGWSPIRSPERVEKTHRFQVDGGHRYYLIWITELVDTEGSAGSLPFWVAISEIRALS